MGTIPRRRAAPALKCWEEEKVVISNEVRGEILYVEISKSYKISLRPRAQTSASAHRNDNVWYKFMSSQHLRAPAE